MTGRLLFFGIVPGAAFLGALGLYAVELGFPDIAALFGLYALGGTILVLVGDRLAQTRRRRSWGRLLRTIGLLLALTSYYCASDAYVQERAPVEFPAAAGWFIAYGVALALLTATSLLRAEEQAARHRRPARIHALGLSLFVLALAVQILTLSGAAIWEITSALHRLIYLALTAWLVMYGRWHAMPGTAAAGHIFLWVGLMTAYLDLLWPYREGTPFLAGWAAFGLCAAFAQAIWNARLGRAVEDASKTR